MSNPYFQFKQFTVWHDKCAMKVGTDGVLLGAWANIQNCRHILDIGTGTGLIALMLAQRCNAQIDAIDIDKEACEQARENVSSSPFSDRIHISHISFNEYACSCLSKYDLIVSNPPYFVDSLKCSEEKRRMARHTDTLQLNDLIKYSNQLLVADGRIALVLPFEQLDILQTISLKNKLYPCRKTNVIPKPEATPKRLLIELSHKIMLLPDTSNLIIEKSRHQYTDEYKALTQNFYLKM